MRMSATHINIINRQQYRRQSTEGLCVYMCMITERIFEVRVTALDPLNGSRSSTIYEFNPWGYAGRFLPWPFPPSLNGLHPAKDD